MTVLETRNIELDTRNPYLRLPCPHWLREMVERRDRGRCARCGLATRWSADPREPVLHEILHAVANHARGFGFHGLTVAREVAGALGYDGWPIRALTDLHHIVPVALLLRAGDAQHRAANLETLCRPCHKAADAHGAEGADAARAAAKAERLERADARVRAALEEKREQPPGGDARRTKQGGVGAVVSPAP